MPRVAVLFLLPLFGLAACASYTVVQIPQREADLYPWAQTRAGITVAIDEINSATRAKRYFGANLIKVGILPVNVIISNHGEHRFIVKPSDVLLLRGKAVVDPLPIEMVVKIVKRHYRFMRSKTARRIDEFFENMALKEMVLIPNESYQGVLFFEDTRPKKERDRFFTIVNLFREGGLKLRVHVTDLETRERIHFGPFSLSRHEIYPVF